MTPDIERPRSGRILSGRSLVLLLFIAAVCIAVPIATDDASADSSGTLGSVTWNYVESTQTLTLSGTGDLELPSERGGPNDYRDLTFQTAVIGDGITSIGDEAFSKCGSLSSVAIPDSVTAIGRYAFEKCTSLHTVTLSDNITAIGTEAFSGCSALRELSIPDSISILWNSVISGCTGLERVRFSSGLKPGEHITWGVCDFNLYEADRTTVVDDRYFDEIRGATFVKSGGIMVRMVPYGADGDAQWTLNNGALVISGTGATADYEADDHPVWWEYRDEIRSLAVLSGITRIGDRALSGLDNLEAVYFGPDIAEIGTENFPVVFYAKNGTTFMDSTATALHGNLFVKTDGKLILTDKQGENGNIGWSYNDGALRVFGTGDIDDYSDPDDQPWGGFRGLITSITIDSGITRIGDFAFYLCGNAGSLSIADTVRSIGSDSLSYTTVLHDLALPNGLTSLGD
ncbi:MAG: leucine-rich repeat protein, partial [Candidatus Methanomethylophilaceae archaeon]|nr:leucine-rich repeat protein [Candidatus Methanomethylophilaceae archaeon]